VADTLAADLVFTAHGHCETAWDTVSTLRGGSGGDMTRYELEKREPLLRELAAFRDAILGRGGTVVTLRGGPCHGVRRRSSAQVGRRRHGHGPLAGGFDLMRDLRGRPRADRVVAR
jgi:hypothetical protein